MTLMLCSGCSAGEFGVLVVDLVLFTRRGRPREEDVNHPVGNGRPDAVGGPEVLTCKSRHRDRRRTVISPRTAAGAGTQPGIAATSGTTMPKRSPMAARLAACTAAEDTFSGVPGSARVAVALATTVAA